MVPVRYRDLVSAVERCAALQGASLLPLELPVEANFPAVFSCQESGSPADANPLFLFFPTDPMLTSDVISRIFTWIGTLDKSSHQPMILLNASALPVVRRALQAAGLTQRCAIGTYAKDGDSYRVSWPEAPPATDDQAAPRAGA